MEHTVRVSTAWAKANKDGQPTLSLIDHSIDVAAVAESLLRLPTISARLGALAKRRLSTVDIARLAFFAGLHDVGKVSHGFQAHLRGVKPNYGHIGPVWSILCGDLLRTAHRQLRKDMQKALAAPHWRVWLSDKKAIWNVILAHHGSLPANRSVRPDPRQWRPRNGYDPLAALADVARVMTQMFAAKSGDESDNALPGSHRFLHALSGLITLADWLGSDESVFKCPTKGGPTENARIPWARQQAADLVQRRWLDPKRAQNVAKDLTMDFSSLFPDHDAPRPSQEALLSIPLPQPGQTTILEAETGAGKTEAALIHFLRLFQAGQVDGLYFALPTRAAAVQIHGRIQTKLKRWFGNASPPVGLAVPGYLRVDEDKGKRLPDTYNILWPDETDRDRAWAVENAKRYLSGAVMVGTIDQVLLGGLRVKHASLRSGLMLRLLLCIDEVHASDSYMTTLLRNVLNQHTHSGGHALLMSATLGSLARMRLLARRVQPHEAPGVEQATLQPYPSLTRANEPIRRLRSDGRQKRVTVELVDPFSDLSVLWDRLKVAADSGAAVLFIRNRVADAQEAVKHLEMRNARLFRCNGTVAPHHGRFAPTDRRLLDDALVNAFSRGNREGVVAVTTQTAEQSLDICADWLVTDIAPGDVLLQRIGRLHRHQRTRPSDCEQAKVTVLAPSVEQLVNTVDPITGAPCRGSLLGLGRVYENIVGVLAVRNWLTTKGEINIPADNRALVEASTHYAALREFADQLGSVWQAHLQLVMGTGSALAVAAHNVSIQWDDPLIDNQPVPDFHAETRLGLKDCRVELPMPYDGPFGRPVKVLNIPGWMVQSAPEDEELVVIHAGPEALRFSFRSREFRYDRFGLVRSSTV